jgi:hypothetical protein
MEDRIERPSYHQQKNGIVKSDQFDMSLPYSWSASSIGHILKRLEYCGHTVNFRTYKDSYKDKHQKQTPDEDLVIFRDTHPPIVTDETFELAQKSRKTKRREDHGAANPLTGKVLCYDCKSKMYNHRQPYAKTAIDKRGYVIRELRKMFMSVHSFQSLIAGFAPLVLPTLSARL